MTGFMTCASALGTVVVGYHFCWVTSVGGLWTGPIVYYSVNFCFIGGSDAYFSGFGSL